MNVKSFCFCCLLGIGALTASCSSENEVQSSGEGAISFDVTAETGFQSRALSEADYQNLDNYTVQLLKSGEVQDEWNYTELPSALKVEAGDYQVKAFYGEDTPASTETMYVEGMTDVTVNPVSGEEAAPQTVSVTCKPVCAKVKVVFTGSMDEYFSDYSAVFKTEALGSGSFTWGKKDTAPVYLKVGQNESVEMTFQVTKAEDGTTSRVSKTYVMSPQTGMTITVGPNAPESEGNLGITIEIDSTTNDKEIDIEVPTEWI